MEYVNLGSTGLKVGRLAFGMVFREQTDENEALRVVEAAIDSGINLIDCANTYGPSDNRTLGPGCSERILARAMRGKRDDLVITSKVQERVGPGPNDSGLSRYHILREVDKTLTRLGTDHLDIYLAHHYDELTPLEETLSAFDSLIKDGKIRYYGLCNFTAWQMCKALWIADRRGFTPPICVQNSYNLLDRALEGEMFGLVRDQGLGVMAYSPLAVGLLSGVYWLDASPPEDSLWGGRWRDRFEGRLDGAPSLVLHVLREIGEELGKTPAQVALAWVISRPEVSVAVMGCDTLQHLEDDLGAVGWTLGIDHMARLNSASQR